MKNKKRLIGQAVVVLSLALVISFLKHWWSLFFLLGLWGGIDLIVIAGKDEVVDAFRKDPQGFADAVKREDELKLKRFPPRNV